LLCEWDDDAVVDFHSGCTKDEKKILKEAILVVSQANENINQKNIYIAVLYYYYLCIVIEYYATELFDLYDITNIISGTNINVIQKLVKDITISNEPWASYTRRTINNLD
jgi:hypothetical protein